MGTRKKTRPRAAGARGPRPVIGWREWAGLPELGIDRVKVKVDTGARSSALHATDLDYFEREGSEWVRFLVRPEQHSDEGRHSTEAAIVDRRPVMSSSGNSELRPFVRTTMVLGEREFSIVASLTDRRDMGFRMLLGRADVRRRFLVDPGRSYLQSSLTRTRGTS